MVTTVAQCVWDTDCDEFEEYKSWQTLCRIGQTYASTDLYCAQIWLINLRTNREYLFRDFF